MLCCLNRLQDSHYSLSAMLIKEVLIAGFISENLTAEKLSIKTQKPIRKNAEGQKIVTLQRGLLQISSSTSINESSFSREASMDSLGSSHSTHIELTLGFLLAIFGVGLMYGLTGVFVRLADESGVGAAETLFVTSAFQVRKTSMFVSTVDSVILLLNFSALQKHGNFTLITQQN